jgi:hypothetical protein
MRSADLETSFAACAARNPRLGFLQPELQAHNYANGKATSTEHSTEQNDSILTKSCMRRSVYVPWDVPVDDDQNITRSIQLNSYKFLHHLIILASELVSCQLYVVFSHHLQQQEPL